MLHRQCDLYGAVRYKNKISLLSQLATAMCTVDEIWHYVYEYETVC